MMNLLRRNTILSEVYTVSFGATSVSKINSLKFNSLYNLRNEEVSF